MEEFLIGLANELASLGITQVTRYYDHIAVAGCEFVAERMKRSSNGILFLGQRFKPPFNTKKAADLLLEELPKRMRAKKEQDLHEQRKHDMRTMSCVYAGTPISFYYYEYEGKYRMSLSASDQATVMAAADCLQDNGFTTGSMVVDDRRLTEKALCSLVDRLSPEMRAILRIHLDAVDAPHE